LIREYIVAIKTILAAAAECQIEKFVILVEQIISSIISQSTAMNKPSCPGAAMFFLLLSVNVSLAFGQTTPAHNPINIIVTGLTHETPDLTLLQQNLETILKVKIYPSYSSDWSSLDFLCDKTPSEIWDKLPQDTKDRFKLVQIQRSRIELTIKGAGKDSVASHLSTQPNDQQAIREVLQLFQAALLNNNGNAAASLLTGDFAFSAYGKKMNKEERLATINSGQYKYGPFKMEDVNLTIYPNTATAVIKTAVKYKSGDKDVSVNTSNLTFTRKEGHWMLLAECLLGGGCNK
jgi:hypothetical protein